MIYAVPVHATDEVREFLRSSAAVNIGGEFIAGLPNGRVFGSGAVLSADGASVARDVSVDFGKPFEEHWLLGFKKIRPPVHLPGVSAVVATALGSGYAHWLLDELPRLIALAREGRTCDRLIVHAATPLSREALGRFQVAPEILEPRRYSHYQCDQLIVPSLIGQPGCPTSRVVQLLAEFTSAQREASRPGRELIYLSRANARRRRVMNEAELEPWLTARGFVKVCTEELPWAEQIAVFRHAKVIVAPHGAGLANLVFCRPGTRVIELFNRAYVNGCYWRLSSIQGLDYRPIVEGGAGPLCVDLESNALDMNVDIERVAAVLRAT